MSKFDATIESSIILVSGFTVAWFPFLNYVRSEWFAND